MSDKKHAQVFHPTVLKKLYHAENAVTHSAWHDYKFGPLRTRNVTFAKKWDISRHYVLQEFPIGEIPEENNSIFPNNTPPTNKKGQI